MNHSSKFKLSKAHLLYVLAVLLFAVYVAPSVSYHLPNYRSKLAEEYQPLQALKFFSTKGHAFHKYGPMENYILAVPYGVTLGYWRLTGQLAEFSPKYPFGMSDPLRQFGTLHFEGRILFLLLSVIFFYFFCVCLERITNSTLIVAIAFIVCLVTNVPLLTVAAAPAPDSPMNFFGAAALGIYVTVVFGELTPIRAICLSLFAVLAITAKELAGPMFVLPYLGIIWNEWRVSNRRKFYKSVFLLLGTGIVAYACLNIVYAPSTWLARMHYWLLGPGIDPAVWGNSSLLERIQGIASCMLDNLGPGGTAIGLVALVYFYIRRPAHWLRLSLPAWSLFGLGLMRMGYQEDRFFTLGTLSLIPMIVAGLAAFAHDFRATRTLAAFAGTAVLLLLINVWYASAAWLFLGQRFDSLFERNIASIACRGADVWEFSTVTVPPASRYNLLGYHFDGRSAAQIVQSSHEQLPQVAMAPLSFLQWLEDARARPARASLIDDELDFDISSWRGMEALGYPQKLIVVPHFPRWFFFQWMPTVQTFIVRNTVVFYWRPCSVSSRASLIGEHPALQRHAALRQ